MTPILEFTGMSPAEARSIALLKLSLVGLPQRAGDLMPSELSGGNDQALGPGPRPGA